MVSAHLMCQRNLTPREWLAHGSVGPAPQPLRALIHHQWPIMTLDRRLEWDERESGSAPTPPNRCTLRRLCNGQNFVGRLMTNEDYATNQIWKVAPRNSDSIMSEAKKNVPYEIDVSGPMLAKSLTVVRVATITMAITRASTVETTQSIQPARV